MEFKPSNNCTPIIFAAKHGHTEIVSQLLAQKDIDINCKIFEF